MKENPRLIYAIGSRPTRAFSPRQLPTDHDYAVPTREYQTDQSSQKLPRPLLALPSNNFNNNSKTHECIADLTRSLHIRSILSRSKAYSIMWTMTLPGGIFREETSMRDLGKRQSSFSPWQWLREPDAKIAFDSRPATHTAKAISPASGLGLATHAATVRQLSLRYRPAAPSVPLRFQTLPGRPPEGSCTLPW